MIQLQPSQLVPLFIMAEPNPTISHHCSLCPDAGIFEIIGMGTVFLI